VTILNEAQDKQNSFTISNKALILEKLTLMAHKSALINVMPAADTRSGFITTITKVLPQKNVFAIDMHTDDDLNRRLKISRGLIFTCTLDGVLVRFQVGGLTPATLGGQPVFAVPLPNALYWRQRRSFPRALIPKTIPMICTMRLPGLNPHKLLVLDISRTGFSVLSQNQLTASAIQIGPVCQECQFSVPETLRNLFAAELCHVQEIGRTGISRNFKLGLRFVTTSDDFQTGLDDLLPKLLNKQDVF
jgi:flagellar brake protein